VITSVIAAIILAGGESRRMGSPKLMLEHRGKTLLSGAIHKAQAVASEVIVVVGAYTELYSKEVERAGARVVLNSEWPEGLASSVRVGVASLSEETSAALIILADQPFVPQDHLQALVDKGNESGAALVFSSYEGIRGAPTLISATLFPQVATLKGNRGLQALSKEVEATAELELTEFFDIDTPEDAQRLG